MGIQEEGTGEMQEDAVVWLRGGCLAVVEILETVEVVCLGGDFLVLKIEEQILGHQQEAN